MLEQLRQLYHRQPFEPFYIQTTDGKEYLIKHPECLAFTKHFVHFANPETEVFQYIYLLHVAGFRVEPSISHSSVDS